MATISAVAGTIEARSTIRVQPVTSLARPAIAPAARVAVSTVSVSPASLELRVGETMLITAEPRDGQGQSLNRQVSFRSENERVAVPDNTGTVRAVSPGTTHIVASSENVESRVTVVVREAQRVDPAPPPPALLEPPAPDQASGPIAQMLRARDAAGIRRTYSEDDSEARTTKAALLTLAGRTDVQMGAVKALNSSRDGDSATAEFSTVLSWRSNFGGNRRADVRISASFVRDGDSWRFTQWRILGTPDLK